MTSPVKDLAPYLLVLAALAVMGWQTWQERKRRRELQLRVANGSIRSGADLDDAAIFSRALVENGEAAPPDQRTWADLDLDAVFTRIDRTASTAGRQVLYAKLRRSGAPAPDRQGFADRVDLLHRSPDLRVRLQQELAELSDPSGYDLPRLMMRELYELPRYTKAAPLLSISALALLIAGAAADARFFLAAAAVIAVNCVVDVYQRRKITDEVSPLHVMPALLATARRLDRQLPPALAAAFPDLRGDIEALRPLRRAALWLLLEQNTANELVRVAQEYLNMFFLLDVNAYNRAAATIRLRRTALRRLFSAVGEIDAACSVAVLRDDPRTSEPLFGPPSWPLEIDDATHPLVDGCVPNSVRMDRSLLVTGSNMSGKSTFLRTLGVNAVLAQTLGVVFAKRYRAPWLEVATSIGRSDDLQSGTSYYLAEVKRVRQLIVASGSERRQLFIIDELFRGTNSVERIAASCAVLEHLSRSGDLVLIATHDIELVDLLHERYTPVHFRELVVENRLTFDYKLQAGRSSTHNAIAILDLMAFPPELVQRAIDLAK